MTRSYSRSGICLAGMVCLAIAMTAVWAQQPGASVAMFEASIPVGDAKGRPYNDAHRVYYEAKTIINEILDATAHPQAGPSPIAPSAAVDQPGPFDAASWTATAGARAARRRLQRGTALTLRSYDHRTAPRCGHRGTGASRRAT